ncbi:MAG: diguanylate cyclase [Pseudomonadota bacterium]
MGESYRVMVIETSKDQLQSYATALSEHFVISLVDGLQQALSQLNQNAIPDAILLDSQKTFNDAVSFCSSVRNNQQTRNTPVVLLSDRDDQSLKTTAFDSGASDYIVKPAALPELVSRIKSHASQYRRMLDLETLIDIDPLTHLPNAAKFDETLQQEWLRCSRYWHHLSLLVIRLDNRELFEKTHSEDEYYALIASLADELASVGARPGDMLASIDEDCFALLLSDCSRPGARLKAKQIADVLLKSNISVGAHDSDDVHCKIAVGVAVPSGGGCAKELYEETLALLQQKNDDPETEFFEFEDIIGAN